MLLVPDTYSYHMQFSHSLTFFLSSSLGIRSCEGKNIPSSRVSSSKRKSVWIWMKPGQASSRHMDGRRWIYWENILSICNFFPPFHREKSCKKCRSAREKRWVTNLKFPFSSSSCVLVSNYAQCWMRCECVSVHTTHMAWMACIFVFLHPKTVHAPISKAGLNCVIKFAPISSNIIWFILLRRRSFFLSLCAGTNALYGRIL